MLVKLVLDMFQDWDKENRLNDNMSKNFFPREDWEGEDEFLESPAGCL